MKRLAIVLLGAAVLNYFYPALFAPVWNVAGKVKNTLSILTGQSTATSSASKWAAVPKTFSFTDISGQTYSFANDTRKPAVIAFWIDQCGYSQNAMLVLNAIRRAYPANQLDVAGFFLNERQGDEVAALAREEGYAVALVAAQPRGATSAWNEMLTEVGRKAAERPGASQEDVNRAIQQAAEQTPLLIRTLHEGFGIRGAGRDIYIIDAKGLIHTIPAVDANDDKRSQQEIIAGVEGALRKILARV
jgi:hypothetical protein